MADETTPYEKPAPVSSMSEEFAYLIPIVVIGLSTLLPGVVTGGIIYFMIGMASLWLLKAIPDYIKLSPGRGHWEHIAPATITLIFLMVFVGPDVVFKGMSYTYGLLFGILKTFIAYL